MGKIKLHIAIPNNKPGTQKPGFVNNFRQILCTITKERWLGVSLSVIIIFFSCFILASCQNEAQDAALLRHAQNIIAKNPEEAYRMLDSIKRPEKMGQELYMQYRLAYIEAKYRSMGDISNDYDIAEVFDYFQKKGDDRNTAYAGFYTGSVYFENEMWDKALDYYLPSIESGLEAKQYTIVAKSENNTGSIFFSQGMYDSAVVHLEKSIDLFSRDLVNNNVVIVTPLRNIASSLLMNKRIQEAEKYIEDGLILARQAKLTDDEAKLLNLKGLSLYKRKLYGEAKKYYTESLIKTRNTQDSLRYLSNYALLYNKTNQLDSSKYYTDIANGLVNANSYKITRKNLYAALSRYYKSIDNNAEALKYKELQYELNDEILRSQNVAKLLTAQENHLNSLKDKELMRQQMLNYVVMLICALLAVVIIMLISFKRYRNHKLKHKNQLLVENNKLLESRNNLLQKDTEAINFLINMLKTVIEKDNMLNANLKSLQEKYQTSGKPEIFNEIEQMTLHIQEMINQQLLVISKRYIDKDIPPLLNNREILFLTLRAIGFSEDEIFATTNFVNTDYEKFKYIKYRIRKKLKDHGISDKAITSLLLSENSILLKDNEIAPFNLKNVIDGEIEPIDPNDKE